MTRYARFAMILADGSDITDDEYAGQNPAIEITDLWVIVRTDITETWTPRERIMSVSVGIDSGIPGPICGAVWCECGGRSEADDPCIRPEGHTGRHVGDEGPAWD